MAARTRTTEERKRASAHVFYEHAMLRNAAIWLDEHAPAKKEHSAVERVEWNVHLESFLLHVRNLMVFLHWEEKGHHDDVRAGDFVRDWTPVRPPEAWMENLYAEVCGRIMHLSYSRNEPSEDWPIRSLTEAIGRDIQRFVDLAGDDLVDESWDEGAPPAFSTHSHSWVVGFTGSVQSLTIDDYLPRRRR